MTRARALGPRPDFYVVFDGQSLNLNTYPARTMTGLGVRWANIAVSGQTWPELTALGAAAPLANIGLTTILVMNGGTQHINNGNPAAIYLAAEEDYADAARAAGYDIVINTTLVPSSTFVQTAGGENDQRIAANAAKLTDPSFDDVVDFAADPSLGDLVWANPPNATSWSSASGSYVDGTHWTAVGDAAAAALMRPVIRSYVG